ncbi:hypothetical protein CK203_053775 [Vitis vinifera]|uniref:Uncharacterized protein n=1 Tax=Vitis vinifera TaxID=29760 RepID=A0A438GQP3_VITVI|nr:hypothetical protein CK203_053775 [Vitis vinifera]
MDNKGGLVRRLPSNMAIRHTGQRVAFYKLAFVLECVTKYTLSEDDFKIADYVFDDTKNPMEVLCLYSGHSMTRLQMHYLSGHSALDLAEVRAMMAFNAPKSLILFIPLMLFAFTVLHDISK